MPLEREILDRTPMRDELRSGESIIVKDEYGDIYEATNIDGYIYRTPLYRDDEDFSFGRNTTFITTEDGNSETSGGGGSIEISPGENTFTILDSQGSARVILGQTDDSPKYGIKINDHSGDMLARIDGNAGETTASIAGWNINENYLEKSGVRLNAVTDNGYLGIGVTSYDENDGIWLGEYTSGSFRFSMKNSDGSKYLKFDNTDFTVAAGNFSVDSSGDITANGGTVAGWIIGTNLFKSAASGARIELNKAKNRVSIFDASSEKIVMGYLEGVRKNAQHDGNNVWRQAASPTAPGGNTSLTLFTVHTADIANNESETAFKDGGLVGMTITMCNSAGSSVGGTILGTITANTFNTIQITYAISSTGAAYSAGNDHFYLTYSSAHYGFWAAKGDTLAIDGDMSYESGDWMIEGDASVRILNGAGTEIIRLGTHNGDKGLFVGDLSSDATVTGLFANGKTRIGSPLAENIYIDNTSLSFRENGTIYGSLTSDTWTLGEDEKNRISITPSTLDIYNTSNKKIIGISGTGTGSITIGNTTDSNTDHSELTEGNLVFNHYQGSTQHSLPYMFAQYIPESLLNLGSAGTFVSTWSLPNMPSSVNYDVIFIPKLLTTFDLSHKTNDQSLGFEIHDKTSTGFTPVAKLYYGGATTTSVTDTTWDDNSVTLDDSIDEDDYAYNTVMPTAAAHNEREDVLTGAEEVNKLTINLNCSQGYNGFSDFTFLVRCGQASGISGSSTSFASGGYKEFTHTKTISRNGLSTAVQLIQSWDVDDGAYGAFFLFSLEWIGDTRESETSSVTVVNAVYEHTPQYENLTGTGKCAALVVGF